MGSEETFEFRVLAAMLANVIRDFEDRLRLLDLLITKATSAFEALEQIDDALIRFLPMKKGIGGFNTSVKVRSRSQHTIAHNSETQIRTLISL